MKKAPLILFVALATILSGNNLFAAETKNSTKIIWFEPQKVAMPGGENKTFIYFSDAQYDLSESALPFFYEKIKLSGKTSSVFGEIKDAAYVPMTEAEKEVISDIQKKAKLIFTQQIDVNVRVGVIKKEYYALVKLYPFRLNSSSGQIEKLSSFNIKLNPVYDHSPRLMSTASFASNSVLATGNWYKVGVTADGIYKMDYNFLVSLGMNISGKNPADIRVYGNSGGQVQYLNSATRTDDLAENAIYVFDGGTINIFDSTDYVLFYGESENRWSYIGSSGGCPAFKHNVHQFTDTTFYFITTDLGAGKRIITQSSSGLPVTNNITTFDDYAYHESDANNMIKSGREWYGEQFDILNSYSFNFNFPNIDLSSSVFVKGDLIGRADVVSNFTVSSGSGSLNLTTATTQTAVYYDSFAKGASGCFSYTPTSSSINVSVTRTSPIGNQNYVGWLNFIEVNARRQLIMNGSQMNFRDANSVGVGNISKYNLSNSSANTLVWEVTDPLNVKLQSGILNGSVFEFMLASDSLREFIGFNGASYLSPKKLGTVPNQNLHNLPQVDMVIIAPTIFWNEATQLGNIHANEDGLIVAVLTPQQIYNEFSSGARDICAIRDFMRMFYERAADSSELPRYLLMYGDGSYDNRQRLANNSDLILTFESQNSLDPINSYVSDDFFVQLDPSEGVWNQGDLDYLIWV